MFNEEQLEDATLSILEGLGYERLNGYDIDRDYHSVFMDSCLFDDLSKINKEFNALVCEVTKDRVKLALYKYIFKEPHHPIDVAGRHSRLFLSRKECPQTKLGEVGKSNTEKCHTSQNVEYGKSLFLCRWPVVRHFLALRANSNNACGRWQ